AGLSVLQTQTLLSWSTRSLWAVLTRPSPHSEELTVAAKNHDWLLAAVEDEAPLPGVGRHGRHLAKLELLWQSRPTGCGPVVRQVALDGLIGPGRHHNACDCQQDRGEGQSACHHPVNSHGGDTAAIFLTARCRSHE